MKISENFLPIDVFDILQRKFLDRNFPWYLAEDVTNDNPNIIASCEDIYNWQFVHNIFTSFVSINLFISEATLSAVVFKNF